MSTAPSNPVRPRVIVVSPLEGRTSTMMEMFRAAPAWLISAGIHGGLLALFFLILQKPPRADGSEDAEAVARKITTQVIDEQKKAEVDLTNVEFGVDPKHTFNIDVNRIAEITMPGLVDPREAAGQIVVFDNPNPGIPLPPGTGRGNGGGAADPNSPSFGPAPSDKFGGFEPLKRPGNIGSRLGSAATRERMVLELGGTGISEATVGRGLEWLAYHQAPNGAWSLDQFPSHARDPKTQKTVPLQVELSRYARNDPGRGMKNDVAGSAFGLLPFLAAGITHKGAPTTRDRIYVKNVRDGVNFLIAQQGKDGGFSGGMYAHGLATIAICEAYGLTSDPALKAHAQAALNYIIAAQDPFSGGWRYQPRSGGDTSVSGWQVMALKSGQMSGLNVPNATLKGAEKWFDSCETKGKYGYVDANPTPAMSAVGLLCRQYLGVPRRNPDLREGVEYLLKTAPPNASRNTYYEYYATQVMHHMGGDYWDQWNAPKGDEKQGMREILIERQERYSDTSSSWSPNTDPFGAQGGRIMTTSLSLLSLEVYYRHLPLYQRVSTAK